MSSYFNEAGEPIMTAQQAWAEAEIDAMNAYDDACGLNDDYRDEWEEEDPDDYA